jgi:hypothetical protein
LVLLCCDFVEQFSPWAVLHDKIHVLSILVGLIILDDVGMIKGGKDADLLLDPTDLISF